jgi:hypothetical protein
MKRTTALAGATLVLAATALPAVGAAAEEAPRSPHQACAWLEENAPDAYEFIATKPGGCESTLASVGLDAVAGGAFPSNASAIGNCRFIEQSFMVGNEELGIPDYLGDGRAYPYQFYWFEGVDDPNLYAENRADCVRILELLHGGYLGGG